MRLRHILCAALLALVPGTILSTQEFSTAPLVGPAAYPDDGFPADPAEWLHSLSARTGPRKGVHPQQTDLEHTYALISAAVRARFQRSGSADLNGSDSILGQLFGVAERLGSFGAWRVATVLGQQMDQVNSIPAEFTLDLTRSTFFLASATGRWRLAFPYYFMVGTLDRTILDDGSTANVAMISTLVAADSGEESAASQATILVISNESNNLPRLAASWLGHLGISVDDTIPRVVPQSTRSYRRYSPEDGMLKELNVFAIPSGSLLIAYIGLPGTYQANRQHYVDLLTGMRVR